MKTKTNNEPKTQQSCLAPVSGSVNESEYYYLGRKIHTQQTFKRKTSQPFEALCQAEAFLHDLGYSYGSMAATVSDNIAVRKGKYDLAQKWHNLSDEDIASIDGVIRSSDFREGSVTVMLFN